MDAETWLTAEEAVEKGFADEIEQEKQIAACVKDGKTYINGQEMDFSRYKNPPKLLIAEPHTEPSKAEKTDYDGLFAVYQAQIEANKNNIWRDKQ
jgi:ATP-dependent Clp protease protease subunit